MDSLSIMYINLTLNHLTAHVRNDLCAHYLIFTLKSVSLPLGSLYQDR